MLRCKDCGHEFLQGELIATDAGWACPKCESTNFKKMKENEVKVGYEEGRGHD